MGISTLPLELRRDLASAHAIGTPSIERRFESVDGTRRYLLALEDGQTVETVLMPEEERETVCISTQVGCPVNCRFCMTALLGLERNLTAGEIVGQVLRGCGRQRARRRRRAPQHRHDGAGRTAAQSAERNQGDAHPAGPGGLRPLAAAHHGLDLRHHPEDRRNWAASRCARNSPSR